MHNLKQKRFLDEGAVFFRAVWIGNQKDPLTTKSEEGRYHTMDDMDRTIYLSATPETALHEVKKRWGGEVDEYVIVSARVKLRRCVDLTDQGTQRQLKVAEKELAGDRWRSCQKVAATLRSKGYEGAWTYSAAHYPEGRSLIIFAENLESDSGVALE